MDEYKGNAVTGQIHRSSDEEKMEDILLYRTERRLDDADATVALGHALAGLIRTGDVILLEGGLGAGKTTLARGIIEAVYPPDSAPDIVSPTFPIVQVYDCARPPVAHFDLYRISDTGELEGLGWPGLCDDHVALVEWPERLCGNIPAGSLSICLKEVDGARLAVLEGAGSWPARLRRMAACEALIDGTDWHSARRYSLPGDASSRRYERLFRRDHGTALLMDMPARPDGPPVRNGLPYSRVAHLAESIDAVVAVNSELRRQGFSAPQMYDVDFGNGLAILEDFGTDSFGALISRGADMKPALEVSVDLLCEIAGRNWPHIVAFAPDRSYHVPDYDLDALLIEADLLIDWFLPEAGAGSLDGDLLAELASHWASALEAARTFPPVWVLRDFHVDNLFWLPDRSGVARVGLIDTQDCVMGSPAYDLVSLLQDARTDMPSGFEQQLLQRYIARRQTVLPEFDEEQFRAAYAVLGAQRAAKILGIFVRLFRRDGKPGYLRHLPRVEAHFSRNLANAGLEPLAQWFDLHLPRQSRLETVARLCGLPDAVSA